MGDTPCPRQGARFGRNGAPPTLAAPAQDLDIPTVVIKQVDTPLLTTPEAAAYLRRCVGWLLHRGDIPYLKGKPDMYRRADLDRWIEENLTTQDF